MKKFFKIAAITLIVIMILMLGTFIALQHPKVQTYIAKKVTESLSEQLGAKVNVQRVNIKFFRRVVLEDVYIEDLKEDTLLYASQVKLGISVFRPFQRRLVLKEIELNQSKINLYRMKEDTAFNFQFIADALSSPKQESTTSKPWDVGFKRVSTTNLDFSYIDEHSLQAYTVKLDGFDLMNDQLDLKGRVINLDKVELDNAFIKVHMLQGERLTPIDTTEAVPMELALNRECWDIQTDAVIIYNTTFHYLNDKAEKTDKGIDFNDLYISDINLNLENTYINLDTIHSNIINLSCKEKSGFAVTNLAAVTTVSPNLVECKQLSLVTPNSNINNYFSMKYNTFLDFNDFVNQVYMQGEFKEAKVSFEDIDYFAKALGQIDHNTITLSGEVRGKVNNLKGRDLALQAGSSTTFAGDISLRGLPNFEETFISLNVDRLRTDVRDAHSIYPHFQYPDNMLKVGTARFTGHFDGFINDFVANGELRSQIGRVNTDINFKIEDNGTALYAGKFEARALDLGEWFDRPDIVGKISLNTKLKGKGLQVSNAEVTMEGVVNQIMLNGYNYKDVEVDGTLERGMFEGFLTVKDDNLDVDFQGTVDLTNDLPAFDFTADLRYARLKELKLYDEQMDLSSQMKLNITGDDIDNIVGSASIFNTRLKKEEDSFFLDTLVLNSKEVTTGKHLTLHSDIIDADVSGNFTFKELPDALKELFKDYFEPDRITTNTIKDTLSNQSFRYSIQIRDTRNLTQLIDPKIVNINEASIVGFFDNRENKLIMDGYAESFSYQNATLKGIDISSATTIGKIALITSIDSILYKDSLLTEELFLDANIKRDQVAFNFKLQDETSPERLDLYGIMKSDLEYVSLNLLPSSTVHLNDVQWTFDSTNHIYFANDTLSVNNFDLSDGRHLIAIQSFEDQFGKSSLKFIFDHIQIREVTPSFAKLTGITIDGLIDGEATILDVLNEPALVASLTIDSFQINEYVWGNIEINSAYLEKERKITMDMKIAGNGNRLKAKGYYILKKKKDNLNFTVDVEHFNLPLLEVFLSDLISKTEGIIKGKLTLEGSIDEPVLNGKVLVSGAQTRVNYLNTLYRFDNEEVAFGKNIIDLDKITLYDINQQKAELSGSITHTYFKDFFMELLVQIDQSQRFQLMNTNFAQGEAFYGTAYGNGLVLLDGSFNDLQLYASITSDKETNVSIPVADSKDVGQYEFYKFINIKEEEDKASTYKPSRSPLSLTLDLKVTQDAVVQLILSREEGDVIKSIGDANLKIGINNYGDMDIQGAYYVSDGDYLFKLQNIVSKKFEMEAGSSILWSGDPYDAKLDISAVYRLRAAPYDLIEDVVRGNEPVAAAKTRIPVYLYLLIRGSLLNPDISFDIKIPETDPAIKSAVDSKIQLLRTDQNELNKQVVGLLVLNRFVPVYPVGNANNTIVEGVNNTVSEFVSNQLSIYLSDWISNFITEVELDINYRTYQNELDGVEGEVDEAAIENRRELQLALTKSFFNERVEVDVGGNFDFGEQQAVEEGEDARAANNIAGDFEIRYSITADGRIKLKVFRKGDYDVFEERTTNKTGVGVSYQREFNNVKDLFEFLLKRKDKKAQKRKEKEEAKPEEGPQLEKEVDPNPETAPEKELDLNPQP